MRKFLLFNPISIWIGRVGLSLTRAQVTALGIFPDDAESKWVNER